MGILKKEEAKKRCCLCSILEQGQSGFFPGDGKSELIFLSTPLFFSPQLVRKRRSSLVIAFEAPLSNFLTQSAQH